MKFNIKHKVNIFIFITFSIIACSFVFILLPFQHLRTKTSVNIVKQIIKTTIDMELEDIGNDIFSKHIRALNIRLLNILKNKNILQINIYDIQGNLIISKGVQISSSNLSDHQIENSIKQDITNIRYTGEYNIFSYLKEINIAGERLGFICLFYSIDDIEKEKTLSFIIFGCLLAGILITMIVVLNFIISRVIISKVEDIKNAFKELKTTGQGKQIKVSGKDELIELKTFFNYMSLEISKMYNQIEQKNLQLKYLNDKKNDFLANTSHELRTPLNGIIGICESLLSGVGGTLPLEAKNNLLIIVTSAKRLTNIVNDILDFSKLKKSKIILNKKPINLYNLVEMLISLSTSLIGNKQLILINSINPYSNPVFADENRLQQIINNLLTNAVKYTKSGSVEISSKEIDNVMHISVEDTGIGIDKEKFENDYFNDEDNKTPALGLSITKKLIKLHDESIWVESKPGKGTKFTFTMKIAANLAGKEKTEDKIINDNKAKFDKILEIYDKDDSNKDSKDEMDLKISEQVFDILVVDDEPINIQVVENLLYFEKFNIISASSGKQALDYLKNEKIPDLILLDIMMPEMSGYDVCLEIRKKYSANELPIIMLTAKNQIIDLVKGYETGANDYITKPVSETQLKVRLKTLIKVSSLNKQLKDTNQRLKESEEKFRGIFENAVEGIFQTTPEGKIISANQSLANIMGYPMEEMEILDLFDVNKIYVNRDERQIFAQILIEQGHIIGFETRLYKKDRSKIWVSISARSVFDENGRLFCYEGSLLDITQRKEKEKAEKEREEAEKRAEKIKAELHAKEAETQKKLFDAFIKSIATAIEEKSAYTGGHIRRVVDLTMMIAKRINEISVGPFKDVRFSDDEFEELQMAAWMHDIGKITTPESVVDKSTKLEAVFDRIDLIQIRFNLIAELNEENYVKQRNKLISSGNYSNEELEDIENKFIEELKIIKKDFEFIKSCNSASEFMSDEMLERLNEIASKTYKIDGEEKNWLTENELKNLSIKKGTLTTEERKIVENHAAMTIKILEQIPFPYNLKNVKQYAGNHHEKLDGSGYPFGLTAKDLPYQSRILTIADIFEALTAKDRPYKKPMELMKAVKILKFMKQDGHIDPDIFDLFVESELYNQYAEKELYCQ